MIRKKYRWFIIGLVVIFVAAYCVAFIHSQRSISTCQSIVPKNLDALLALSNEEIQKVDIAVINLLCAEGLPGSENIDIEHCLKTLDEWAAHVLEMEEKYKPAFHQNRKKYENSYALFQAVYLNLALELDYKCRYNMKLVNSGAMSDISSLRMFADSRDLFLHGFVNRGASRTGTCGSLPVLATAVGRRCGYPVFLVVNKGHSFCRWDDGQNRYNFETAGGKGTGYRTDEYFMKWPHPIEEGELEVELYMQNLDAVGELVFSLEQRAACLRWNKEFEEACAMYEEILNRKPHLQSIKIQLEYVRKGLGK